MVKKECLIIGDYCNDFPDGCYQCALDLYNSIENGMPEALENTDIEKIKHRGKSRNK